MSSFSYEAQTPTGQALSGTLAATDQQAAQQVLESLHLRVMALTPAAGAAKPARARTLSATDFQMFNQQLAYLATAGLPVEQGLRLIAQDVRSGRLSNTINAVAADLDRGVPLADAFGRYSHQFPPFYGQLIAAGVKSNNLPAMLLNLGRHLELLANLRAALWRAAAYPMVLFLGLMAVATLISWIILPQFRLIFMDFRTQLPAITEFVLAIGPFIPFVALAAVILVVGLPLLWGLLGALGFGAGLTDLLLWVPLLGPVLKRNLMARWCDALMLGVQAGLALPEALTLAEEAVGSPLLVADSQVILACVTGGGDMSRVPGLRVLSPTIVTAMQLAIDQNDLANVLESLALMYQQQAQQRLTMLPTLVTPLLMVIVGSGMGLLIVAMFLPLVRLIQSVSG
jgi:type II secretory pathway component PulF